MEKIKNMTPQQIVNELDKYIIGQGDAKRNVAIALRNRWRRLNVRDEIKNEIIPNNILMIGATGVGKTEIARRLAKLSDAPFTKVEASKFTEVGYVGRDVESMVRDLVEQSVNLVKTLKKEEVKIRAEESVNKIILDVLIPPVNKVQSNINLSLEKNSNSDDKEINEKTRDKFKEKIKSGELDDRKIEIMVQKPSNSGIGMVGGGMMDESSMINLQDMISNMMPKRNKKRKVTIGEAKKILLESEVSKLIDMDEVKEEAIDKAENTGIIFIDEIDKISGNSNKGGGPDVSREGVQRDLLPIVEGTAVTTKYGIIKTDHILFIAAGAFHLSKPSDMLPELQGRLPIRVELESLSKDGFKLILTETQNSLIKQYVGLLGTEKVSLEFDEGGIESIASLATEINQNVENIGARRLHTIMEKLLEEVSFNASDIGPTAIIIDKKFVETNLVDLIKSQDLSKFIL